MNRPTRRVRVVSAALLALATLVFPALRAMPATAAVTTLTNLSHLDFLTDRVAPPEQAGHTTYRLAEEPEIGVLWTYADRNADGTYRRIGGGQYDAASNTYGQGAFNADDISRAAVVYLRHAAATGSTTSLDQAYQLLRGLTYLQTATGPNAGNVVLWMQPDGTLNPSAEPVELPDPSDSDASYWLARTLWALGEGYALFRDVDPAFGSFVKERLDLAVAAVERQVLDEYGERQVVDGQDVPAWLITDGADASAEAVLGLAAYVQAGATDAARTALAQLAEGIAEMSRGDDARAWPYGAILPWAQSESLWHAWGSQMPAALAAASNALGDRSLLRPAQTDTSTFTPYLLADSGPDNGWLPSPDERVQIAYGADSRLQSLLAVADVSGTPGPAELAVIQAAWYFGANRADEAMYDPSTGRTFDGLETDGRINRNSGAESTIHGLLSMLALDARPELSARAQELTSVVDRRSTEVLQLEDALLSGAAEVVTPDSAWTGESLWSGGKYVHFGPDGSAAIALPDGLGPRVVLPVVRLVDDNHAGRLTWYADDHRLGAVDADGAGPQGVSAAPGSLQPVDLIRDLPAETASLSVVSSGPADVDAVLLRPLVTKVELGGAGAVLLQNAARQRISETVDLVGEGAVTAQVFDGRGRAVQTLSSENGIVTVRVPAGGYAVVSAN
ncbi:MAG: hypothetical protein ABWZ26_05550 [Candidatus Nanopelagicales bacterium]